MASIESFVAGFKMNTKSPFRHTSWQLPILNLTNIAHKDTHGTQISHFPIGNPPHLFILLKKNFAHSKHLSIYSSFSCQFACTIGKYNSACKSKGVDLKIYIEIHHNRQKNSTLPLWKKLKKKNLCDTKIMKNPRKNLLSQSTPKCSNPTQIMQKPSFLIKISEGSILTMSIWSIPPISKQRPY